MLVNGKAETENICVKELTKGEFCDRRRSFDLIFGLREYDGGSQLCYYDIKLCDNSNTIRFALINRFMGIRPQIEIFNGRVIIGNNNTLSIVDIATKQIKEYSIPIFYEFIICRDLIVVVGELSAFCLKNDELLWIKDDFKDIIDIVNFENDILTLVTYEEKKEIHIDVNTGKIISA